MPPAPPPTMEDWLKAHKVLLDEERKLSDLALAVSQLEATQQELDEQHEKVLGMRSLVEAVLSKVLASQRKAAKAAAAPKWRKTPKG